VTRPSAWAWQSAHSPDDPRVPIRLDELLSSTAPGEVGEAMPDRRPTVDHEANIR
jgi:hypothetical protein